MGGKPRTKAGDEIKLAVVLWELMSDQQIADSMRAIADEIERRYAKPVKHEQ